VDRDGHPRDHFNRSVRPDHRQRGSDYFCAKDLGRVIDGFVARLRPGGDIVVIHY
jgi:hypothetical protein